jgi:GT2 family glycosyltransferase
LNVPLQNNDQELPISSLDIIIVNWNSGKLISECINSIKCAINENFILLRIVVVDNASTDNSIEMIKQDELPLIILQNSANSGFAKACNHGAEKSTADYLLFLNPDTKLFDNSLSVPISFLKTNKNAGIVGVKLINEFGEVSRNCARFPTPLKMFFASLGLDRLFPKIMSGHFMKDWDHLSNRIVDQVMGSFFMIKKPLFEILDGYDERFFVYYEDVDLALRTFKKGYISYYLADAQVYHKGGGTTDNIKADRLFYILRSKLLYAKKHFGIFYFILIFIATIFIEPIVRIVASSMRTSSLTEIKEIIRGYKKLIYSFF